MNIHPAVLAAGIMATVLLSGLGKMNLIHHEVMPQIIAEQQVITTTKGFFFDRTDIRFGSEIKNPESVRGIIKVLQEASYGDTVIFHLAGYGGQVETTELLINNVQASHATVIMSVEAPVYSGHAYIALSGDRLTMAPYSSLMLHTSSDYGTDCSLATGVDRTVSNVEHCQAEYNNSQKLIHKLLSSFTILTPEELNAVETGHDFYLTADEYNQRVK